MTGFLGTGASFLEDANLLAQLAMGLTLLGGMALARRGHYRAHGLCQSTVVLLNLIPIAFFMLPAFRRNLGHAIPEQLADAYTGTATAHAALGVVAELFGIYILASAGTRLLPSALRFRNFRPYMRIELALWWAVITIGATTYLVWNVLPVTGGSTMPNPAPSTAPETVDVAAGNFDFTPAEVRIAVGTTVTWTNMSRRHTVTADDGRFVSNPLSPGQQFSFTFMEAGTYPFYCEYHGEPGGRDMAGTIVVGSG